jgi:indolepyruvate ferredoxin oxidoreductase
VPVSLDALVRAIELNAAAVEMNKTAFNWGRMAAHDPAAVRRASGLDAAVEAPAVGTIDDRALSTTLDERVNRRRAFLTDYQNAAWADRYAALVAKVRAAEAARVPGSTALTEAVARYAFKLMAYKDEYEVARLYSQPGFWAEIDRTFAGDFKVHFNLAPPLLAKKDADGHLVKAEYGPWIRHAFRALRHFKFLRGTAFDPFGRTEERRLERQSIEDYFARVEELLATLDGGNVALAVEIASIPEHIRGYGHVKERHLAEARRREAELLAAWRNPQAIARAA